MIAPKDFYTLSVDETLAALAVKPSGLSEVEAKERLKKYGKNKLPTKQGPGPLVIFIRQFKSPLIYILLFAAALSAALNEWTDSIFIMLVLLANATIGAVQEFNAEKSAEALQAFIVSRCFVRRREGELEVNAEDLVPGDIVLLESGNRVPADLRLISASSLEVDESALTGESLPVLKDPNKVCLPNTSVGDPINLAYAGTMVSSGRATGVVIGTALNTEIGRIASSLAESETAKPPLVLRMERFTTRIAIAIGVLVLIFAAVSFVQDNPLSEVLLLSVALAVSAIPEGLPIALTVALAIGMRRMSKRNVIVRKLTAMEALGSCTFIASDKTGTLTLNELTVTGVVFPKEDRWEITGTGMIPDGELLVPAGKDPTKCRALFERIAQTSALCNEGMLAKRSNQWVYHGDTVDIALLVMAHKTGISRSALETTVREIGVIPFEPKNQFAARFFENAGVPWAFLKGAPEKVVQMCSTMATEAGDIEIDHKMIEAQSHALASEGYRVLAIASGAVLEQDSYSVADLQNLTFLGLVAMIDPLRPEAKEALELCRIAGISVAMVTGDHPVTALAISRSLGLASSSEEVVTGNKLRELSEKDSRLATELILKSKVFARVDPQQKLSIVQTLAQSGHFVAVTGDGVNDAPALKMAHVGVAMGKKGTDLARETADLIVTDDNFASIVAGIEEGRIAYNNVRKVIYLLVSTGAAEILLFLLSMINGLPMPLTAIQLLWLNLVTNGIQDVALAFEPGEGDELQRKPRPPKEPIFNRLMIERCLVSATVVGGVSYLCFWYLLAYGWEFSQAQNLTLLLLVLFENIQVGNSRSETRSGFTHSPLRNKLLLVGTALAQLIHISSMYTPGLKDVLRVQPVSFLEWITMLGLSISVFVVMELHKVIVRRRIHGAPALS